MNLASMQVTTIERVATYRMPEDSSTLVAYQRGNAARGGGPGGGGRRGGGGAPAAGGGQTTGGAQATGGGAPGA
jgi:hypothetical protein